MRKIENFLNNQDLVPANLIQFPYDKLVPLWNSSVLCFRLFVSPTGNDSNDGLSWSTAKRTIQSAVDVLPTDLLKYTTHIYILGGSYSPFNIIKTNGNIALHWVGTWLNSGSGSIYDWIRNGESSIAPHDDPIVITATDTPAYDDTACMYIADSAYAWLLPPSLDFSFNSTDHGKEGWQIADMCYWDKIRFLARDSESVHLTTVRLQGIAVDLTTAWTIKPAKRFGLSLYNMKNGTFRGVNFLYNNTEACTSTSAYRGLIDVNRNSCIISLLPLTGHYYIASAAPPSDKRFKVDGCRNFITLGMNGEKCSGFSFDLNALNYSQGSLPDADLPRIVLNSACKDVVVKYNSDQITIVNSSVNSHITMDYKTSITANVLSSLLKEISSNLLHKIANSAPSDSILSNGEMAFWVDESNNKLMFKLKYSNGTVKSGEVVLT